MTYYGNYTFFLKKKKTQRDYFYSIILQYIKFTVFLTQMTVSSLV